MTKTVQNEHHDQRQGSREGARGSSSTDSMLTGQFQTNRDSLQRSFGNAALGRRIGVSAQAANPQTADSLGGNRYAQSLDSIVQRAVALKRTSAHPAQQGKPFFIQRLMLSQDFVSKLEQPKQGGQYEEPFGYCNYYLGHLESVPDVPQNAYYRGYYMQQMYTKLYVWLESEASKDSANKAAVEELMQSIKEDVKKVRALGVSNLANTQPGNSPGVKAQPVQNTPPNKSELEAFKIIETAQLNDQQKGHAKDMIQNPSVIVQGAFGVCGLTSILFAVATSSPVRFATLIRDAWEAKHFTDEWMLVFNAKATPEQKTEFAEVEYIAAQYVARRSVGQTQPVTQKVLNTDEPQKPVSKEKTFYEIYREQTKFSDSFEIQGWENTEGHFAMTTGALTYLLNTVGSGKPAYKVKIRDFGKDFQVAKAKAGNGSILASVTDTSFYTANGQDIDQAFIQTVKPKFVHWVILKNVALQGDFFKMDVWTWNTDYKASVHKDVIHSFIYSLVVAESDS